MCNAWLKCCPAAAASGSAEDISALSLALQIIDADQQLQQSMQHLKQLSASDMTQAQTAPGVATPCKGPCEGPSPASEKRLRGKQLAAANAKAAADAKAAELQALHAKSVCRQVPDVHRLDDECQSVGVPYTCTAGVVACSSQHAVGTG